MLKRFFQIFLTVLKYSAINAPRPVKIRLIFQDLKGAFVKLGQILALRSDVVSTELAFELLKLLDDMDSISESEVEGVFRREFGKSPEEIFAKFEKTPIAVASFGQVHKALTFDGQTVAVKIQRPEIQKTVLADLKLIKFAAQLVDALGLVKGLSATKVAREFTRWTWDELNYLQEAEQADFLQAQEQGANVKFPKIFWPYTTKKILTEEFIEGRSIKELLSGNTVHDARELSRLLIANTVHQYFLGTRFHADPHAGNILVDEGRLAYVDFGIVGKNRLEHRIAMANFVKYSVDKNYDRAITAFLHLGFVQKFSQDLPYLLTDQSFMESFTEAFPIFKDIASRRFAKIMDRWHGALEHPALPFVERSAAKTFLEFLQMIQTYQLAMHEEVVLFLKTLIAVDAISLQINPQFNLVKTIQEIFAEAEYASLFSKEAFAALDRPLVELKVTPVPDSERAQKLKDYYEDWLLAIYEMHEQEFSQAWKKKTQEIKKPPVSKKDGLPEWIVEMHKVLKHSKGLYEI